MAKKALLIIDMLNDFVQKGASLEVPDTRNIIPAIQREIKDAHEKGDMVIYICDSHAPDDEEFDHFGWPSHGVKGTAGADIIDELKPSQQDSIIEKTTYSGFYKTKLDTTLKGLGVNTLRLTGCVTHICVMFIAYEAAIRGYRIEIVGDGVAGLAPEDHETALRIMQNVLRATIV